ncbi:MAG: extracellular solute-binding protein [Clostridia bacterium]|nr:extracellular solute-binding protein [Clostridia bacterium]
MKPKNLTAAVLLLLTLCTVSCGSSDGTSAVTQAASESVTTAPAETETERLYDNVENKDYGGTTFDILTAGNWSNEWTEIYEFTAEEENGEPINDAVYARNLAIEERFNVEIVEHNYMGIAVGGGTGKGSQFIEKSVLAADCAYDASLMGAYDVSTLAYNGYLLDLLTDVPNLDLTQPWWDQKAVTDVAILDKVYYTTGDISTIDNDCTFCILFNKNLLGTYDMESPYELVKNGTWTIEKFVTMASQISTDVNGDSKYDENDLYGLCVWQDSMMGMINAAGGMFCSVGNDGKLALTLNTERNQSMFAKWIELAANQNIAYSIFHSGDNIETMFANDQVLFYTRYLCIIKKYRDMDTDFGVLPYPKYDEAQKEYYSTVAPYGCSFLCVPAVLEDVDMTGRVLEAMACESLYTVTPAYYDITLEGKTLRDDESSEMLDIILGNRVFDLGQFYQVGGYNEEIMNLYRNKKTDFVSMYEKFEKKALKKLDEINEAFAAVE